MLLDVTLFVGEPERVVPLVQRIVDTHVQALGAAGLHEVERDIAFGADIHGIPRASPGLVGLLVAPEREALVVLAGERDVLGARAFEDVGPMSGVVKLGAEHGGEIEVWEIGPVDAIVKLTRGGVGLVERVPIPFGVHGLALGFHGRVRGDGVDAPVDEDAELGIGVPGGGRGRVDGFPGGLVACLAEGALSRGNRQRGGRAGAKNVSSSHLAGYVIRSRYSERSVEAGSMRTARKTAGKAASSAAARITSSGPASMVKDFGCTR